MTSEQKTGWTIFGVVAIIIVLCLALIPPYKVWSADKRGEASYRYAVNERRAAIAQAEAERDSAVLRAEAIEIIGKAAQEFPEYRQQEFIGAFARCLEIGCASQIIYVPTEANIPITEAGRLKNRQNVSN